MTGAAPGFEALLSYTEWERRQWRDALGGRDDGAELLGVSVGPHNDGRFETVGALIGHIFSAELRYVDRLSGRAPASTADLPIHEVEPLFREGERSRRALVAWIQGCPPEDWDEMRELQVLTYRLTATPAEDRHACPASRDAPLGAGRDAPAALRRELRLP